MMTQFGRDAIPRSRQPLDRSPRKCQYVFQHGPDAGRTCEAEYTPRFENQVVCEVHAMAQRLMQAKNTHREYMAEKRRNAKDRVQKVLPKTH